MAANHLLLVSVDKNVHRRSVIKLICVVVEELVSEHVPKAKKYFNIVMPLKSFKLTETRHIRHKMPIGGC